MIDVNKVKNEFDKYVQNYDINNERIKLKVDHIKRVAKNCELISKSLNLSQEEIDLAISIGYFHDIGRFEQVRLYGTFSDKLSKVDHAELGCKILFENNLIRNFIEDAYYDEIIKKSVLNHNKYEIEKNLSDKEILFSKIIRDADKLDILYTISDENYSMRSIFWYDKWDDFEIGKDVLDDFYSQKCVNYSKLKTNADIIVISYAYMFDLNFQETLKLLYQNRYLDKFTDRVIKTFSSSKVHLQALDLLKKSNEYLVSKI